MKHLIFKLAIFSGIVTLILISYFTQPSAEINKSANNVTTATRDTQYHIGAFDNGWYSQYNYLKDSLKFNVWHNYSELFKGWYQMKSDRYDQPITDSVRDIVSANKTQEMRTYMDRPIIQYIVAGQRADYQCEQLPSTDSYWFYAFNFPIQGSLHLIDTTDNHPIYGSGEQVRYCKFNPQYPITNNILIDSGVISDRELSFNATNSWMNDKRWDWYVMPRIRIDSSYAAGTVHNSDTVCRIQITGWKGQIVKDVPIRVRNFKELADGTYHGNYLDTFYFTQGQENLKIDTSLWSNFSDTTDHNFFAFDWTKYSGNDIKIYWSGKCDMWIDRIRLENVPAHQYMTLNNQTHQDLVDRVNTEIDLAQVHQIDGIPNYIYFEECEFSHFQAIKELNAQIMQRSSNTNSLVIWLNYDLFRVHIPGFPNDNKSLLNASQLKKYLNDDFGLNTIVMGSYSLEGYSQWDVDHNSYWTKSYHPNTLSNSPYNKDSGVLSTPVSPELYDGWLQTHLDTGRGGSKLIYINKLMDELSKNAEMRIINCPQAHLWYSAGHKLKEPSNEELELQTCLSITYNAKGTMYFGYTSSLNSFSSDFYSKGIIEWATSDSCSPRHNSVYYQDKFKKIGEINSKLQKWGPYIMKFDPISTKSCSYKLEDERTAFLNSTYFSNIISYRPGSGEPERMDEYQGGNNPPNLIYDCNEDRYLQVATFQTSTTGDKSKYFMIVNRRCSPYINEFSDDNRGGKRNIRVTFDANTTEFANFNNWEIIDIDSNKTVAVFDKRTSTIIDLGWYMPGQGKLYKIVPVMLEGGTFITNEYITASAGSFECKGNITNNGYELEIEKSVTINFKDNVGINFSHSNFKCGISGGNTNNVFLKGSGSDQWNGK